MVLTMLQESNKAFLLLEALGLTIVTGSLNFPP